MTFKPYNTIDEMLEHVNRASTLSEQDPEQINARLNRFRYKKYISRTNKTLVIKEFDETSYNGPTHHDFINRLNILFDATKTNANSEQLKALAELKKNILDQLTETCKITPVKMNELLNEEKEQIKIINKARKLLQEYLCKAIRIIAPDGFKSDKKLSETLTLISNNESKLTETRGRPNFINYYPINDEKTTCTRLSINRVVGKAIPSTERLGSKLPNFVECGIGYMNNGMFVPQFKGYRHSSYTPIKMIDKKYGDSNYQLLFGNRIKSLAAINKIRFRRRQAASNCAKDMFIELARQQIAKGANIENTIPITLSSLALLSPIKGDKLFMRRGESEHRQLKESYNALMMYHGREVVIDVDGQQITVKPSINIMNTASNWHGIKASKYMPSTLEKNINAEGMNKYIMETEKYLKRNYISGNIVTKALQKKQATLKEELSGLYHSLEGYLNQEDNASTDPNYLKLLKSIEKSRDKICKIEHQLLNERLKVLKEKRGEIAIVLDQLANKTEKSNDDQIAELFYQSLFIYIDKTLEPAHFGSRYLLVNEKMGHSVDFYCKSGEDRTGRMQNMLEELCEFSREKGHFPRYDLGKKTLNSADQTRQKAIALIVSERSVSRDNTNSNAHGARGLQITSSIELNKGLANASGSKMGTLAKSVYNQAAIKKLWRSLKPVMTNTAQNVKTRGPGVGLFTRRPTRVTPLEHNEPDASKHSSYEGLIKRTPLKK